MAEEKYTNLERILQLNPPAAIYLPKGSCVPWKKKVLKKDGWYRVEEIKNFYTYGKEKPGVWATERDAIGNQTQVQT